MHPGMDWNNKMTRMIFWAGIFALAITAPQASAQPTYYAPGGYQGYHPQQYYAQPGYYPQYQPRPSPSLYFKPGDPVEIWLSKRIGRVGDYWFPILGGKKSHPTPKGTFTVKAKHYDFYSRKYKSPMPRSVFFTEQCAIHVGSLKVMSHGCIHVDWEAGQAIYDHARTGKTKVKVYK